MTAYKINDDFPLLTDLTLNMPQTFSTIGTVMQDSRNIIKMVRTPYGNVVVKNFKGMYFFNRLAYSLFRRSKASRSYLYSDVLKEKGVVTPTNVAWINRYTCGLLMESYYISVYSPYPTLNQYLESLPESEQRTRILHQLAAFALKLHRLGIFHGDFSTGNILVIRDGLDYAFSMVDLNRIKFGTINHRKGLKSFDKLGLSMEDINVLIAEYARLSGQMPETSITRFWTDKKQASFIRSIRKRLRKYTLTPLEKILTRTYIYLAGTQLPDQFS